MRLRRVVVSRGEVGQWVAECPSLPGCITQGETREAAVVNSREAISADAAALVEDDLPVPEDHLEAPLVAV